MRIRKPATDADLIPKVGVSDYMGWLKRSNQAYRVMMFLTLALPIVIWGSVARLLYITRWVGDGWVISVAFLAYSLYLLVVRRDNFLVHSNVCIDSLWQGRIVETWEQRRSRLRASGGVDVGEDND